jgi:hypothetical protein
MCACGALNISILAFGCGLGMGLCPGRLRRPPQSIFNQKEAGWFLSDSKYSGGLGAGPQIV